MPISIEGLAKEISSPGRKGVGAEKFNSLRPLLLDYQTA